MAVEGPMRCVKFLLYVILLAFCACAVGLIAVGVAAQIFLNQAVAQGATTGSLLPLVIIAVGSFLFLVAFVGCCGTCKENSCLVITFAVLLSLIVLVEVAVGIAAFAFKNEITQQFKLDFRHRMEEYRTDNSSAEIVDKLQEQFSCCGADNYTDWATVPSMPKDQVPDSCCLNVTAGCGVHFRVADIHREGCTKLITSWLSRSLLVVAEAALGIAAVEVLGVVFACLLVKSIRSGYEVM